MRIDVTFREQERSARGRNGWFEPAEAYILGDEHGLMIDVVSKRPGDSPPITLRLKQGDARALARAITKVAGRKL